ncbi:cation transport ATPase [Arthrobacter sp. UYCu712]
MEHQHSSQAVNGGSLVQGHQGPRNPGASPGPDDEHRVHSHGQHAGHSVAMFKNRFWLTLLLAVPVVLFSPMFGQLLGYEPPLFPGSVWIPPVRGTVIFLYGGQPFLQGGLRELKSRKPGVMLLIAMAISVAFTASWVTTPGIGGFDLDFWWELALLVAIMLLGQWIEMRAPGSAQGRPGRTGSPAAGGCRTHHRVRNRGRQRLRAQNRGCHPGPFRGTGAGRRRRADVRLHDRGGPHRPAAEAAEA